MYTLQIHLNKEIIVFKLSLILSMLFVLLEYKTHKNLQLNWTVEHKWPFSIFACKPFELIIH